MEKYWKLLDIKEHEYSTHETEEEINHIIEFKTRNMEDDRVIRRIDIKTPFPNYIFQYVVAFDSENIYYFLYFFDSIEEQCDCFEEELHEREQLISDINVHRDVDIDEMQRKFEDAFEAMESSLKDEIIDQSNQLDKLKEQNANLVNMLNKKTTALFNANRTIDFQRKQIYDLTSEDSERLECVSLREMIDDRNIIIESLRNRVLVLEAGIKESECNEEFWKSQYEKYKKFVDGMHKQSADFMYGCDDDFPF